MTKELVNCIENEQMKIYRDNLQTPTMIIVGWLLNVYQKTFNFRTLTKLHQQHDRLKDYPIQITPKPFKLSPHDTEKRKDDPSRLMVAAVLTSRDKKV